MKQHRIHICEMIGRKGMDFTSICAVAILVFLYIILKERAAYLYENLLVIPCTLFLSSILNKCNASTSRKALLLSSLMMAWFLILQIRRSSIDAHTQNLGLFFATYLFAYPLAALTGDQDRKQYLKLFAAVYTAAAVVLAGYALLLIMDCLPGFMTPMAYWDGARLVTLWHPNLCACYFLIGIAFSVTFLSQTTQLWKKAALVALILVLLLLMALTNGRTTILLTGAFLGGTVFFKIVKGKWKLVLPGLLVAAAILFTVFTGASHLYQTHQDALLEKFTAQYHQQQDSVQSGNEENAASLPIKVDKDTGKVSLKSSNPQSSLSKNMKTLNGRTKIWSSALYAIREWPALLVWGIDEPGTYISYYNTFPVIHAHNSWIQCLLGLALPGFAIAMVFTLLTLWNCGIILLKHQDDGWKVTIAMLTLCLMAAGFMEPYLFLTTKDHHPFDFLFFLCAGYLACWQSEENRQILRRFRDRLSR